MSAPNRNAPPLLSVAAPDKPIRVVAFGDFGTGPALMMNGGDLYEPATCTRPHHLGAIHGWLLSGGNFTAIDVPGAAYTSLFGINPGGDIVGSYMTVVGGPWHGFLLRDGAFTLIDLPGAPGGTFVVGINPAGDISGSYCTDAMPCGLNSGNWHGFVLRDGEITSFDFPGAIFTLALHINPSGQIVGRYRGADGNYHGFLRSGEEFSSIDFPGAACTIATGINAPR